MNTLPKITTHPIRHPQSCASISLPLLSLLDTVLPSPPSLTLSVGSGPGLLEAVLLDKYPSRAETNPVSLLGVEVATPRLQPVYRFLPEPNAVLVPGTWALASELASAEGLLFVYPRQRGLIQTYLEKGDKVNVAVWIGPRCDMDEMTGPLRGWGMEMGGEDVEGLVEGGEAVVVFRKRVDS